VFGVTAGTNGAPNRGAPLRGDRCCDAFPRRLRTAIYARRAADAIISSSRVRYRPVPEARVRPGGGATTAWRLNEKTRSQPLETAKEKSKTDRRSEVAALAFVAGGIRANSRRKIA
jgi:hypothetical protein